MAKGITYRTLELRLKRANAIIEIIRVFYGDKVRQAEKIADLALKDADATK